MDEARSHTRLYVEDALAPGGTVGLGPERAHFLKHVLRLGPGARVALFNARDGEYLARIDGIGKGWASLAVEERRRAPEPEGDLWLLFAPVKFGRIDFLAQKATELGVSRLQPVFTRRTAAERVTVARPRANAIEAAEQSARLGVPAIGEPLALERAIAGWPHGRPLYVCAERGAAVPAADAFARQAPRTPAAILTGPEGGFERAALDALLNLPFVSAVALGPRILRADTAALAALAVWQAVAGDWRARGSKPL